MHPSSRRHFLVAAPTHGDATPDWQSPNGAERRRVAHGSHGMESQEPALTEALARALKEAETKRDELGTNDPMRAIMEEFLAECTRRLSQPNLGERPKLPDRRRGFVGRSESDVRRPSRDAAYTAIEKLIEAAWPTMSNTDKQLRKRQKQRHEAELQGRSESLSGNTETPDEQLADMHEDEHMVDVAVKTSEHAISSNISSSSSAWRSRRTCDAARESVGEKRRAEIDQEPSSAGACRLRRPQLSSRLQTGTADPVPARLNPGRESGVRGQALAQRARWIT